MWGRTIWYNNCTRRAARSNSRPRVGANPWRGSRNGRTAYFNSRPRVGANVRYLPDMLASFWLQLTPPYRGESNLISAESMLCPTPTHAPCGGATFLRDPDVRGTLTPAPVCGANLYLTCLHGQILRYNSRTCRGEQDTSIRQCRTLELQLPPPYGGANSPASPAYAILPVASTHAPVWANNVQVADHSDIHASTHAPCGGERP